MPHHRRSSLAAPILVKFHIATLAKIREAVEKMHDFTQQDVIRLATEIGLARLRLIDYQIASAVERAAAAR